MKGQATVAVIILILIVGLFVVFQQKTTPIVQKQDSCITPDSSRTVTYAGETYELIKENAAMSQEQFPWHIHDLEKIVYKGEERLVRRASTWEEATLPGKPANFNPKDIAGFPSDAKHLLFLDVTDPSVQRPGYIFVDIFLKKGEKVPAFIDEFCASGQPVNPITIFSDPNGKQFPPVVITKNQLQGNPPAGDTFTLFAYERIDSKAGQTHSQGKSGTVQLNGKTYPIGGASYAGYLVLFDEASGVLYLYSKNIPPPAPTLPVSALNTLQVSQLESSILYPWGWWSPECKPAIYLYPEQKSTVSVSVEPKGYLTYTDPIYPAEGWKVEASPNGTIVLNNKNYPYLYYESKIKDMEIEKPTKGYVVSYGELPSLFENILPKLGLSALETKDFKEFWDNKLPKSSYYFVGVMTENAINRIEPLTVLPKPQTIIRVRLYFEALDAQKTVEAPNLVAPIRSGFVVSEWGGVVKLHPGTEFTCSQ